MKLKLIIHTTILCLLSLSSYANKRVTHYTVNDGLSQHSVTSIIQDQNQMLWIGTFDGLNRFDGRKFISYRHLPNKPNSLASNRILTLHYTDDNELWILYANNKVGRYDYQTNEFHNYNIENTKGSDLGNLAHSLISIDTHLIVSRNGNPIFIPRNKNGDTSQRVKALQGFIEKQDLIVNYIALDNNNQVWLATNKGIGMCYFKDDECIFKLKNKSIATNINITATNTLIAIYKTKFIEFNIEHNKISGVRLTNKLEHDIHENISLVKKCMQGDYFIAANSGLRVLNAAKNKVDSNYFNSIPIREIYEDNMGGVWCGSQNGLYFINKAPQPIFTMRFNDTHFDLANHIKAIYTDSERDEMWVSTNKKKIHLVSRKISDEGDILYSLVKTQKSKDQIFSINKLAADTLILCNPRNAWLVTYNTEDYTLKYISKIELNKTHTSNTRCLIIGKNIWFGSIDGLTNYSFTKGKLIQNDISNIQKKLPQRHIIMSMVHDPAKHHLWIAYRGAGLYRVNISTSQVVNISDISTNSLSSQYVWSLLVDKKRQLWIGTDAGLDLLQFDSLTNKYNVKSLTQQDGLVNDKIDCIEQAENGTLWLGTSQGIINYDASNNTIKTYNHLDGFQSNSFNQSNKWSNGDLIFGGVNGISLFNPDDMNRDHHQPKVAITELRVNDEHRYIHNIYSFKFRNHTNHLRVDFASFYSTNLSRISYEYILEGFNEEWRSTDANFVEFSNLEAGEYKFKVRSVTSNGSKSYNTETLELKLRKPIYLSTTFIIIYILLLLSIVVVIILNNISRKMLANKLAYEEDMRQNEKHNIEEKLKFYTNMAHEIKTPLTLIQGPALDIAYSKEATPYILSRTELINNNINILQSLTEQILDFRSAIKGKLNVELNVVDIMVSVQDIVNNYQSLAIQREIKLTLESNYNQLFILFDESKLTRILYNLLSNALKFTDKGGIISLSVDIIDNQLKIAVKDTGRGIDPAEVPYIFKRFYKVNSIGGSGIGLAFSKSLVELLKGEITVESQGVGYGSCFSVTFPSQDGDSITRENPHQHTQQIINKRSNKTLILLVEDNIELNNYLKEILQQQFDVIQNYDGQEALETIRTQQIDLLITDVMIPHINGIKLCEKLRQFKHSANTPIIIISAKTSIEDQIQGLTSGAIDYITKPFNPHILMKKVTNILEQYYASRKGFESDAVSTMIDPNISLLNRDEIFIKKAKTLVYKKLRDEEFSVNQMSNELGVSRVHLTREFNRILGTTPSTFIRSIKLNHAKHLLADKNQSIKEVLFEIGIRSHSGFTRIYKEKFGYLPSDEIKNKNN